jgi:hypothetical protein
MSDLMQIVGMSRGARKKIDVGKKNGIVTLVEKGPLVAVRNCH